MLVNSLLFWLFVALFLLPYFMLMWGNSKIQNLWLLTASYVFYGYADWMTEYGKRHKIKTLDFKGDTTYVDNPELFYDATHLNNKGAHLFTNSFILKLNK